MKEKKKSKIKSASSLLFFIVAIILFLFFSENTYAQTLSCEELLLLPFGEQVTYPTIIDQAILCNMKITNEQFKLASQEMKEKYVLTANADFSYEEQNSEFIRVILKDTTEINENIKETIKRFLEENKDYSFYEQQEKKSVKDVFEKVANKSISFLNENMNEGGNSYKKYFSLTSEFVYISSSFDYYEKDTGLFLTNGPRSTAFTNEDIKFFELQGFSEFYLKSDGRLGAQKYKGVTICEDCDYYISADGKKISVQSGRFNLNDKSFSSDSPYVINVKDNNEYEVSGSNIIGINPETAETIFRADGSITVLEDEHYILGKETNYEQYKNNKKVFDIETKEKTELFTKSEEIKIRTLDYGDISPEGEGNILFESEEVKEYSPCKDSDISCIYWNPATNNIDVNIKDNSVILRDDEASISYLDVAQIKGKESSFSYYNNEAILQFTESSVTEKGEHDLFPSYTAEITEDGEQYEIISGSSGVTTCASPCTTSGSIKKKKETEETPEKIILPERPSNKVDSIMVITANPFEGQNKINKSKIFNVNGLYVWNTVQDGIAQSSKANIIKTITTNEKYTPVKTSTDIYTWTPDSKTKSHYKLSEDKQVNNSNYKNTVVIITGHHGTGRGMEYIYSEHHYFKDELASNDLQFSRGLTDPSSRKFYDLKYNPNVYVVMFSACNTVKMPYQYDDGKGKYSLAMYPQRAIQDLSNTYPNLRLIIGYDNIAPGIDLIYNTNLDRGTTPNTALLNNPKDTGLINFDILETAGFKAFGDKATDIYKVDLVGLAKYREAHPEEEAYSDRYQNGKRIAYYYRDTNGEWYFHTNYAYDKRTDTWVRKEVTFKINVTEKLSPSMQSQETKDALAGLNS